MDGVNLYYNNSKIIPGILGIGAADPTTSYHLLKHEHVLFCIYNKHKRFILQGKAYNINLPYNATKRIPMITKFPMSESWQKVGMKNSFLTGRDLSRTRLVLQSAPTAVEVRERRQQKRWVYECTHTPTIGRADKIMAKKYWHINAWGWLGEWW